MTKYKKIIFPLIVAGLMLGHVPMQAFDAQAILFSIKNATYNVCRPLLSSMWSQSTKAVQENKVATGIAVVGGLGLFTSFYCNYKFYKSNKSLKTANTLLNNKIKNAQGLAFSIISNTNGNGMILELGNPGYQDLTCEKQDELKENIIKANKYMEDEKIRVRDEGSAFAHAENNKEFEGRVVAAKNNLAIEIANAYKDYYKDVSKQNLEKPKVFECNDLDITPETKQTIAHILLNNLKVIGQGFAQIAQWSIEEGIQNGTVRLEKDKKGLAQGTVNLRKGLTEQYVEKNKIRTENEQLKIENKKLKEQINEIKNGKPAKVNDGMKRSNSFDDLRKKDPTVEFLANYFPVKSSESDSIGMNGSFIIV